MSTRAETFDKNQQNWARELRHSTKVKGEESTSAAGMSTRAETFDTNRQKWARELRHSKEFASAAEMSTRAETFASNRQKWARELRHSIQLDDLGVKVELGVAHAGWDIRHKSQKWARGLRHSIQFAGLKPYPDIPGYTRGGFWAICVEWFSPRAHFDEFEGGKTKGWAWERG